MILGEAELLDLASREPVHEGQKPWGRGSQFQRERIAMLAERAAAAGPGDLLEVGCYQGSTSHFLAKVAADYGRRFVAVDNWDATKGYDLRAARGRFLCAVGPWRPSVDVIELDVHSAEAIAALGRHRYCFAFLDNGHEYEDVATELRAVLPLSDGLVAVDDVQLPWVRKAVDDVLAEFPQWRALRVPPLREWWLEQSA